MKTYVVGILSFFENELKLFKIDAESKYDAVKIGMVKFYDGGDGEKYELDFQASDEYPKDFEGLYSVYEEIPFNVIEI